MSARPHGLALLYVSSRFSGGPEYHLPRGHPEPHRYLFRIKRPSASPRATPEEVSQVSQVITVPPPASAAQALGMLKSAMGYLAAADATAMDYRFTGKPRLTPPWLGSSQRDVTALPRV